MDGGIGNVRNGILNFCNRELAAEVIYKLVYTCMIDADPAQIVLSAAFLGAHIRTEKNVVDINWPKI